MLDRIDNKYIMPAAKLARTLAALTDGFDILEIEGKHAFTYSARYFDDVERRCYYDHHQRRRKRVKARVRHYVDADFSFLEVKLNELWSMTAKHRLKVDWPVTKLDDLCMDFDKSLIPVIVIEYRRITLCRNWPPRYALFHARLVGAGG